MFMLCTHVYLSSYVFRVLKIRVFYTTEKEEILVLVLDHDEEKRIVIAASHHFDRTIVQSAFEFVEHCRPAN